MKVINFFGGPCSGKSTAAAGLFYLMKKQKYNVELVTEFAKDLVYEDHTMALSEQNYVFANQEYRLARLEGKIDYAISDSPLILSNIYCSLLYPQSFEQFCLDMFNRYENINFFIQRNHVYSEIGRINDETESTNLTIEIEQYLIENNFTYKSYLAGDFVPELIYAHLKKNYL